jgi:hypothetical protein
MRTQILCQHPHAAVVRSDEPAAIAYVDIQHSMGSERGTASHRSRRRPGIRYENITHLAQGPVLVASSRHCHCGVSGGALADRLSVEQRNAGDGTGGQAAAGSRWRARSSDCRALAALRAASSGSEGRGGAPAVCAEPLGVLHLREEGRSSPAASGTTRIRNRVPGGQPP